MINKQVCCFLLTACLLSIINSYGSESSPQSQPVNPNALSDVRFVLKYIYERKDRGMILSSQHISLTKNYNEAEHVRSLTGKMPSIVEFDLLNFHKTPARKERYINFAKAWSKAGGLVAVSWHETSPELCILDEGGYQYGTKKMMTQERFEDVLTEGTELNRRWRDHLDLAACWLGELQKAGVVVLWRPYHEMTGDWFWWGGKKPETFRVLWRKAYEHLTNRHRLNNLIWVWSAAQVGDDYAAYLPLNAVDVVGIDIYITKRDDPEFLRRANMIRRIAQGKPIALTEVGTIPCLDILINRTEFTWFSVWGRGFLDNQHYSKSLQNGSGNSPAWILETYAHPKVITKDEIHLR